MTLPRPIAGRLVAVIGCLVAPTTAVLAHHSGLYDEDRIVEIEGTIESVTWINPHVHLRIEVERDGRTQDWEVEGTSLNALERWGIDRELFRAGDRISVIGPVSRFESRTMIAATVELADGRRVALFPNVAARLGLAETGVTGLFPPPERSQGSSDTPAGSGIFRVWTPRGRPADTDLPLTDLARGAVEAYIPLVHDPALRCLPPGMPAMLDTPYPIEFVRTSGDRILMRFEEWDAVRTIYMDPNNGPDSTELSLRGVSVGRWAGETLEIFTTYIQYPYFDSVGTPQSELVSVLERYTPNADYTRLDWDVTTTDPSMFTEPVVRRGYYAYEAGEVIKPFNCVLTD